MWMRGLQYFTTVNIHNPLEKQLITCRVKCHHTLTKCVNNTDVEHICSSCLSVNNCYFHSEETHDMIKYVCIKNMFCAL